MALSLHISEPLSDRQRAAASVADGGLNGPGEIMIVDGLEGPYSSKYNRRPVGPPVAHPTPPDAPGGSASKGFVGSANKLAAQRRAAHNTKCILEKRVADAGADRKRADKAAKAAVASASAHDKAVAKGDKASALLHLRKTAVLTAKSRFHLLQMVKREADVGRAAAATASMHTASKLSAAGFMKRKAAAGLLDKARAIGSKQPVQAAQLKARAVAHLRGAAHNELAAEKLEAVARDAAKI